MPQAMLVDTLAWLAQVESVGLLCVVADHSTALQRLSQPVCTQDSVLLKCCLIKLG